jgi:hypothetical protein
MVPLFKTQVLAGDGGQALVDETINRIIFLPENLGVVRIGANTFDAEQQDVFERKDIWIGTGIGMNGHSLTLLNEVI